MKSVFVSVSAAQMEILEKAAAYRCQPVESLIAEMLDEAMDSMDWVRACANFYDQQQDDEA